MGSTGDTLTETSNDRLARNTINYMAQHMGDAWVQGQGCIELRNLINSSTGQAESDDEQEERYDSLFLLELSSDNSLGCMEEWYAISVILTAMKQHRVHAHVQMPACCALWSLAHSTETRVNIAVQGGITAVLTAMAQHAERADVQGCACCALGRLAKDRGAQGSIVEEGGLTSILNAMGRHVKHPGVQTHGCFALTMLTNSPGCIPALLLKQSGLDVILQAIGSHKRCADVQINGVAALCNLAFHISDQKKDKVPGVMAAIVEAMEQHRKHASLQEMGCKALADVIRYSNSGQQIVTESSVAAIAAGMVEHSEHVKVQENGCDALTTIALDSYLNASSNQSYSRRIHDGIVREAGIELILAAMASHVSSTNVQLHACQALSVIMSFPGREDLDKLKQEEKMEIPQEAATLALQAQQLHSSNRDVVVWADKVVSMVLSHRQTLS